MDLKNKNFLVVGGSSGIGHALVELLAQNGANIFNVSRTAATDWPEGVNHLSLNILDDVAPLADFIPENLHGLVYAVGSINLKPFNRLTGDDFLNDYRINVVGAVKVIQQALKPLKNAVASSIVLVSTVAAKAGMSFHASVAAAKSGVEGLGLSLAAEFAPQQIRVNVVAPSLTDTPLAQNLLNTPEKKEAAGKRHPLGKYGQASDIAASIAFLLSTDSSWITGQVIGIDGGLGKLKF